MNFRQWLENQEIQKYLPFMRPSPVSPEQAKEMFGPVYHGSAEDTQKLIKHQGFEVFKGPPRVGTTAHGYKFMAYGHASYPPPIHHLGFGVYFTTSKTIAKNYNYGTAKGLVPYYISGKVETINFGSPNTMMKWWRENGYDVPTMQELNVMPEREEAWIQATSNLTETLKSKYDAVWFKGKGLRTLLDGDQICVYHPNNIHYVDYSLSTGYNLGDSVVVKIGDRIQIKGTRATAKIMKINKATPYFDAWHLKYPNRPRYRLSVYDIKNAGEIEKVYKPILIQTLIQFKNDPKVSELLDRLKDQGTQNPIQDIAKRWMEKSYLQNNMPSQIVAGVLKPRQRTKEEWAI